MREGVEWIFSGISSRLPLFAPERAAHIKDTHQTGQIFPFFSKNRKKTPRHPAECRRPASAPRERQSRGAGQSGARCRENKRPRLDKHAGRRLY